MARESRRREGGVMELGRVSIAKLFLSLLLSCGEHLQKDKAGMGCALC